MTSVFISYSHDSESHRERVQALVEAIRDAGLRCAVDLDFELGSPAEGWGRWADEHIEHDDFVLVVCSRGYREQDIEGVGGRGRQFEVNAIAEAILRERGSSRFIPVLFSVEDEKYRPAMLTGTYYDVSDGSQHEALIERLRQGAPRSSSRPAAHRESSDGGPVVMRMAAPTHPPGLDRTKLLGFGLIALAVLLVAGGFALWTLLDDDDEPASEEIAMATPAPAPPAVAAQPGGEASENEQPGPLADAVPDPDLAPPQPIDTIEATDDGPSAVTPPEDPKPPTTEPRTRPRAAPPSKGTKNRPSPRPDPKAPPTAGTPADEPAPDIGAGLKEEPTTHDGGDGGTVTEPAPKEPKPPARWVVLPGRGSLREVAKITKNSQHVVLRGPSAPKDTSLYDRSHSPASKCRVKASRRSGSTYEVDCQRTKGTIQPGDVFTK